MTALSSNIPAIHCPRISQLNLFTILLYPKCFCKICAPCQKSPMILFVLQSTLLYSGIRANKFQFYHLRSKSFWAWDWSKRIPLYIQNQVAASRFFIAMLKESYNIYSVIFLDFIFEQNKSHDSILICGRTFKSTPAFETCVFLSKRFRNSCAEGLSF